MYWQKRFDRKDPDAELLQKMQNIGEEHKYYGYRRIHGELQKQGVREAGNAFSAWFRSTACRSHPTPEKAANSAHTKVSQGESHRIESTDDSTPACLIRKLQQILPSLNTMILITRAEYSLKQEMYYGQTCSSFDELKEAIEKYIRYYNVKRIKASLGHRIPIEYREYMLSA